MKSVLLLSYLLLIVSCVAGDAKKAVRPPLRTLTKKNTAVVMEKPAIYWKEDFCVGVQDETYFPNAAGCEFFWMCINEVLEAGRCADNMFFDSLDMVCDFFEYVTCYEPDYEIVETTTNPPVVTTPKAPEEIPIPDSQCPPRGSTEIIFLPSKNCNEYYICHNGLPNLFFCRPGTHWNANEQFCDLPSNAGCTEIGGPNSPLPECRAGFTGSVPHPWNCNWFVFCNNGNRLIQQCPHLHHFDVNQGRCVLFSKARCINDL